VWYGLDHKRYDLRTYFLLEIIFYKLFLCFGKLFFILNEYALLSQFSNNIGIDAVKFLLLRLKILVEPSGAVPAAAVLFRKLPKEVRSVGVVLSGGNVDFEDLAGY